MYLCTLYHWNAIDWTQCTIYLGLAQVRPNYVHRILNQNGVCSFRYHVMASFNDSFKIYYVIYYHK